MIHTASELSTVAEQIRRSAWVALDTEADSLHAYPEKLCLIQLAFEGGEALVDPLADLHLEPLFDSMDGRELIFHAADYDLRLLFQCHHFRPTAIFDTMWAARMLGEDRFGLNDVLTQFLGITLEKGAQKANWGKRPLTERMVTYALNDVRHLRSLEELFREKLTRCGRLDWHAQLCNRLITDCAKPEVIDPETVWRTKGHDRLDEKGLAVLRELWHWRELDALRTGRPPFFILSHEMLSELATQAAEKGSTGLRLPYFLTNHRRQDVLAAIERGLAVSADKRPRHIRVHTRRMTRPELDLAEKFRRHRDAEAKKLELDPTLIASKSTLFALGRRDPGLWESLLPWQRTLLKLDSSNPPH
ncbi:MAG: ribonuclease D [Pedosphaera sp.]|nr:ribonuclease D [Pedosphaera sp.]